MKKKKYRRYKRRMNTTLTIKQMDNLYDNMKQRCSRSYQKKHPTYKGVKLCKEWKDKQKFIDWIEENYYAIPGDKTQLDKDIKVKGNKVYSPDTCMFVPECINIFFNHLTRKPVYNQKKHMYRMCIMMDDELEEIGYFETEEEAKKEYIKIKKENIKDLADRYKDSIPEEVYKRIVEYPLELEDWEKELTTIC